MRGAVLARGETCQVASIGRAVRAIEDVISPKLYALDEHRLDVSHLLAIARALREQIDWSQLQARTADFAYAKAFFTLVRELGIAPGGPGSSAAGRSRVRVVPGS